MGETNELELPIVLILLGILGMLLLAVAIIVFFLVYQKRLFSQKQELLEIESVHQKALLKHSFEAQEEERKRIAADLHDDIGSKLSATRIYINQFHSKLSVEDYQSLKTETKSLIDSSIDQIRGISHNLFPPNLELLGLRQAVHDFCQRIRKMKTLNIQLECHQALKLSKQEELVIYRILQELVNNTLKHAQATQITIRITTNPFQLIYQDNGKGFDVKTLQGTAKGIGLKSIESRAASIEANIHFKSQEGEGMFFELII